MDAAREGHLGAAKLLLGNGADIEAKDQGGKTPLISASESSQPEVMKLLLDKGADTNAKDKHNRTALKLAAEGSHTQIVELLKAHGAKK